MNKKVILRFVFILLAVIGFSKNMVFGLDESFLNMIDTVGIPRYNVYGEEINEWVYYIYNIFVYSDPDAIPSSQGQRWKGFAGGRWLQYGYGQPGEYYILGRNYSGGIVHNVRFPVDKASSQSPEVWTFANYSGALESWNNKNIYKTEEQREYMKNVNLLFDDINYQVGSNDPYNLIEYNINVNKIGLNKAKLDTVSTWKTEGVIFTKHISYGRIWDAVFATPPMAASANVKSNINVKKNYELTEDMETITIPIAFGAEAVNLTGYAKREHIKNIQAKIYINGKEINEISGSKTDKINKNISFNVSRNDLIINQNNKFIVKVDSLMYTEFAVDGLMKNSSEVEFLIYAKKKKPSNPLKQPLETKVLKKDNNATSWVVSPLNALRNIPYIQGGQHLLTKLKLEESVDNIETELAGDKSITILGDKSKEYFKLSNANSTINKIHKIDDTTYLIYNFIPFETKSSINSWNSLRDEKNSYFDINVSDVSKQKDKLYSIDVKVKKEGYEFKKEYQFNVFDNIINNFNFNILQDKTNINKIKVEDWLKE